MAKVIKLSAPARRKTNVEMIADGMNFSPTGALAQAFIIEALDRYSKLCAEADASKMESALISGEAWKRTAIHWQKLLQEHFQ